MTILSKLQQYNYSQEDINHNINYLKTNALPPKLNGRQRKDKCKKQMSCIIVWFIHNIANI